MLSAYCPGHGATVLFWPSSIVALRNTPIGIEVVLDCVCGTRVEVLTGRTVRDDQRSPRLPIEHSR